jgi:hypothetical protein
MTIQKMMCKIFLATISIFLLVGCSSNSATFGAPESLTTTASPSPTSVSCIRVITDSLSGTSPFSSAVTIAYSMIGGGGGESSEVNATSATPVSSSFTLPASEPFSIFVGGGGSSAGGAVGTLSGGGASADAGPGSSTAGGGTGNVGGGPGFSAAGGGGYGGGGAPSGIPNAGGTGGSNGGTLGGVGAGNWVSVTSLPEAAGKAAGAQFSGGNAGLVILSCSASACSLLKTFEI